MTLDDLLMAHATRLRVAGDVDRAEVLEDKAAYIRDVPTQHADTIGEAADILEMLGGAAIDALAIIRATVRYPGDNPDAALEP